MESHNFKLKTRTIDLDESEMSIIHQHYIEQCTADYIRNRYPEWSEEKVQAIAIEARRQMYKYDYEEEEAIDIAIGNYDED